MEKSGVMMFFVGLGILILACTQNDGASIDPARVVTLDKHSKPGRRFMYLDESGQVVYASRYRDIPVRFRSAVVVLDRKKRKPRRRRMGREEKSGFEAGKQILSQFPPGREDREEIQRELEELRREQALHDAGR